MSELHCIKVTIQRPHGDSPGRVSYGYFTIEGNKLSMCGENGKPIVDRLGIRYERTLQSGQDPYALACYLTREIRRKVTGDNGFTGAIHYPGCRGYLSRMIWRPHSRLRIASTLLSH